jgi:hypothetical protein
VRGDALKTLLKLFMGDLSAQLRVISPTLGPKTQEESQKYFYITFYFFNFKIRTLQKWKVFELGSLVGERKSIPPPSTESEWRNFDCKVLFT